MAKTKQQRPKFYYFDKIYKFKIVKRFCKKFKLAYYNPKYAVNPK